MIIQRIVLGLVFIHVITIVFFTYYLSSQKKFDVESTEVVHGCSLAKTVLADHERVLSGLPRIVQKFTIEGSSVLVTSQYGTQDRFQMETDPQHNRFFLNGTSYSFGLILNEIPSFLEGKASPLCIISLVFSQNDDEGQLAWFMRRRTFKQALKDFVYNTLKI